MQEKHRLKYRWFDGFGEMIFLNKKLVRILALNNHPLKNNMMNKCLALLLLVTATKSFGQKNDLIIPRFLGDSTKIEKIDTAFRVVYADTIKPVQKHNLEPVFFMNGKLVNKDLISILNPHKVENIEVLHGDTLIDNVQYRGKVYIKTKNDYNPKSISLSEIKNKYSNLKGKPVLFFIDGNIVNADYDDYLVD